MRVVSACYLFSTRPISVQLWHCKNQIIHLHHNQRLYKIPINSITHPRSTGLYFKSSSPLRMPSVNLILKVWLSILTKEDWALDFIFCPLTRLNAKAQFNEIGAKYREDTVAI